jgi:hypothetical protein
MSGRSDKKFCDDACRSNYHYRVSSESNNTIRRINNQLKRNRKVLQQLVAPVNNTKIPISELQEAGFNLRYFTHTTVNEAGEEYRVCYDYAYRSIDNDVCLVVKSKK